MECKEQHVGIPDHGQVGQAGEQQPRSARTGCDRSRGGSSTDPAELGRLVGLRDVAPGGVHHRHLVAAGAQGGDDLHGRGEGHVALRGRPTCEDGYPHHTPEKTVNGEQ